MTALALDPTASLAAATPTTVAPPSRAGAKPSASERAHAQAADFEAMFLSNMFQHMFTSTDGEGPLGNTTGTGPWRSFLTDAYAKSIAKSGGIGIADQVYRSLIAHQEASAKPAG